MIPVRVKFSKKGSLMYISHLDLAKTMQRIVVRSDINIWYSEGFNPHIYITFLAPLALGYESECEMADFKLNEDVPFEEVKDALNKSLPNGIRILEVACPDKKPLDIAKARYRVKIEAEEAEKLLQCWNQFISREEIIVSKRSKKGEKTVNVKSYIEIEKTAADEEGIVIEGLFSAGMESNINPTLVTDAFLKEYGINARAVKVLRRELYDQSGKIFR